MPLVVRSSDIGYKIKKKKNVTKFITYICMHTTKHLLKNTVMFAKDSYKTHKPDHFMNIPVFNESIEELHIPQSNESFE